MDIVQRIQNNQLMDEDFDIFVNQDSGGLMTDFHKERFDTLYTPYLPPICLEQVYMKQLVEKCMNTLRLTHNVSDICPQMLCGCVFGALDSYISDICDMMQINRVYDDDDCESDISQ